MVNAYVLFVKDFAKKNNLKYGEALKKSKQAWKDHKLKHGKEAPKSKPKKKVKFEENKVVPKKTALELRLERDASFELARQERKEFDALKDSLKRAGKSDAEIKKKVEDVRLKKQLKKLTGGALPKSQEKKANFMIQKIKFNNDKTSRNRILRHYKKVKSEVEKKLKNGTLSKEELDAFLYHAKILAGSSKTNQYAKQVKKVSKQYVSKKFEKEKTKSSKKELKEKAQETAKEQLLSRDVAYQAQRPQIEAQEKQKKLRVEQLVRTGATEEEAEVIAKEELAAKRQQAQILRDTKSSGDSSIKSYPQYIKDYQVKNGLSYQKAVQQVRQNNLYKQYQLSQISNQNVSNLNLTTGATNFSTAQPIAPTAEQAKLLKKDGTLKAQYQRQLDDAVAGYNAVANFDDGDELFDTAYNGMNSQGKADRVIARLQKVSAYPTISEENAEKLATAIAKIQKFRNEVLLPKRSARGMRNPAPPPPIPPPAPPAPRPPAPVIDDANMKGQFLALVGGDRDKGRAFASLIDNDATNLRTNPKFGIGRTLSSYKGRGTELVEKTRDFLRNNVGFSGNDPRIQRILKFGEALKNLNAGLTITQYQNDFSLTTENRADWVRAGRNPAPIGAVAPPAPAPPAPVMNVDFDADEERKFDALVVRLFNMPNHQDALREIDGFLRSNQVDFDDGSNANISQNYNAHAELQALISDIQDANAGGAGLADGGALLDKVKKSSKKMVDKLKKGVQKVPLPVGTAVRTQNLARQIESKLGLRNPVKVQDKVDDRDRVFLDASDDVYKSPSSRPKSIGRYLYNAPASNEEHAVYVDDRAKNVIIAYRGSTMPGENAKDDWLVSDRKLSYGQLRSAPRFQREDRWTGEIMSLLKGYNVAMTGHSLGGTLAIEMGEKYNSPVVSFNAGYVIEQKGRKLHTNAQDVKYYSSKGDLVSANGVGKFKDSRLVNNSTGNAGSAHLLDAFKGANEGGFATGDTSSQMLRKKEPSSQAEQPPSAPQGEAPPADADTDAQQSAQEIDNSIPTEANISQQDLQQGALTARDVDSQTNEFGGAFHRLVHKKANNLVSDLNKAHRDYSPKALEKEFRQIRTLEDFSQFKRKCMELKNSLKKDLHELNLHAHHLKDKHSKELVAHQIRELTNSLEQLVKDKLPFVNRFMEEKFSRRLNHEHKSLTDRVLKHKDSIAEKLYRKEEHQKKVGNQYNEEEGGGFSDWYRKNIKTGLLGQTHTYDLSTEKGKAEWEYDHKLSGFDKMLLKLGKKLANKVVGNMRGGSLSIHDHNNIMNATGLSLNQIHKQTGGKYHTASKLQELYNI